MTGRQLQLLFLVLAILAVAYASPYEASFQENKFSSLAKETYFEQPVGHLNYIDDETWMQRLFTTG